MAEAMVTGSAYHERTGYNRYQMKGGALDWRHQPVLDKSYRGLPVVDCTGMARPPGDVSFSEVVASGAPPGKPEAASLEELAACLGLAYGCTAKSVQGEKAFYFRSVPSAGALYPCELYVATRAVSGLEDGLYHYTAPSMDRQELVRLRSGVFVRRSDPAAKEVEPALAFFVTVIFFRSAWKYRDRAYRYHLLDAGHLLESLVLALRSLGWASRVSLDFSDERANRFLGLDPEREGCLAMVWVPETAVVDLEALGDENLGSVQPEASRVSAGERPYELISAVHRTTSVLGRIGVESVDDPLYGTRIQRWQPFGIEAAWPETLSFVETVQRRRSRRNFVRNDIPEAVARALVSSLWVGFDASGTGPGRLEPAVWSGFFCRAVAGLKAGFYLLDETRRAVGLVREGDFLKNSAHVCLDQGWLSRAAFHFVFVIHLESAEDRVGPRVYRHIMLAAGRLGHRIYLAATALGLGACGIGAFYDGEARELLGLGCGETLLYLVGAGPLKRSW